MKHPNTRLLFDYWLSVREDNKAPMQRDIEPQYFKKSLTQIFCSNALIRTIKSFVSLGRAYVTNMAASFGTTIS